jgi:apolipoprotein N-acyltransferase
MMMLSFPWALLGNSQYLNLPAIQIADITGVWGVSFVVVLVNRAIYGVVSHKSEVISHKLKSVAAAGIVLLAVFVYGFYMLHLSSSSLISRPSSLVPRHSSLEPLRISVIQGNIPKDYQREIYPKEAVIDTYEVLTRQAAADNPDLIIWPEAALPFVAGKEEPELFNRVKDLAAEVGIPLVAGAVSFHDDAFYNSALLISSQGKVAQLYDKLHLVPFGEYIPGRRLFPALQAIVPIGEISPGQEYTIFSPPGEFSVLICFEDVFPELSRQFVRRGAALLVNITNDSWFKKTPEPYQHLQASVLRAVENRVWLARSANTGVSAFIAPTGRITASVADARTEEIFVSGVKTQTIAAGAHRPTVYNRWGDFIIVPLSICAFYGAVLALRKGRMG